jgi:hypothetical protein
VRFIFRYIEVELFGLFACHVIHEYLSVLLNQHDRIDEEITDTCFQVRCKRNQQAQRSVSS